MDYHCAPKIPGCYMHLEPFFYTLGPLSLQDSGGYALTSPPVKHTRMELQKCNPEEISSFCMVKDVYAIYLSRIIPKKPEFTWDLTSGKFTTIVVHAPGTSKRKRGSAGIRVHALTGTRSPRNNAYIILVLTINIYCVYLESYLTQIENFNRFVQLYMCC